ncbi:hypothetical protein TNCT_27091 [Trichonephila clavata]|uniref:Uncharacterized protein n=1 Tax=Trichonephila clavata TaxID=2740835 RepID=A0A8X6HS27_TRICU|nr:hypothetical protein TNCT_27091 [Trichonephila clavata]
MNHPPSPKDLGGGKLFKPRMPWTQANPSDTDYFIGQVSEEHESLLEANFKQAAPSPLTGTLLTSLPKK